MQYEAQRTRATQEAGPYSTKSLTEHETSWSSAPEQESQLCSF